MQDVDIKVIGYTLLGVGLALMAYAALNVVQVFNGHMAPVQLFDIPAVKASLGENLPQIEVIPKELLNKSSNLIAYLFFMGFIASIGSKLSGIGTKLLRPIRVNLRTENGKKKEV